MSESGALPTARLEDVVDVLDHMRVPVNGTERLGRSGAVPYFGANGLQGWIDRPLFNEPLILLAEDGGNFDEFSSRPIAYRIDGPSWINNHAHIIRAKDGISQSFVFWSLVNKDIRRYIAGGTRTKLTQGELRRIEINLPTIPEQETIATILDTLDTAIHETEAIIAKLKAVKQGLLHDLLTRGIDANGELRPPQAEAPHLYKQSPLGWIPKEWAPNPIGELAESLVDGPFGSSLKTSHYVEDPGVRVVRLQNILAGEYDDSERAFISKQHAASLARNRVIPGDVLIASLGDANYPVARSCCYPAHLPEAINKADCFRFRANALCHAEFVMFSMNGFAARSQARRYEQGVTMKRINLGNLRRVELAVPSLAEQALVVGRLDAIQQGIEAVKLAYEKLRSEKSALMDDLLTGRVRVTPLLTPTPA